jgi:hypothetical protein
MQVMLTEAQASALADLIGQFLDEQGLLLTRQGTSVYAAFGLASFHVGDDGTVEEAG